MQEKAFYVGLKPWELKRMSVNEFYIYYQQQIQAKMDELKAHERFTARICAILANINRDSKKKKRPFREEDFMHKEKKQKMTSEQMVTVCKALTMAFGGEIKDG